MNRKNLKILADYLESGEIKAEFDMSMFTEHLNECSRFACGSVGCAVGHGPYAGIPKNIEEDWVEYSERVFGLIAPSQSDGGTAWEWCFSSGWYERDNSISGASKRIKYLLENGLPEDSFEQILGDKELCYV